VCVYIYIYIYIERERERERDTHTHYRLQRNVTANRIFKTRKHFKAIHFSFILTAVDRIACRQFK